MLCGFLMMVLIEFLLLDFIGKLYKEEKKGKDPQGTMYPSIFGHQIGLILVPPPKISFNLSTVQLNSIEDCQPSFDFPPYSSPSLSASAMSSNTHTSR